jgi:hypothetical protein
MRSVRGRRRVLSARTRRIVWLVGSVVAVALVILIAAAFSVPKLATVPGGGSKNLTDAAVGRGYAAALAALASGETTKGLELLRAAAAAGDPAAQNKLDELTKSPAGSTPETQTPASGEVPGTQLDVATLLPAEVSGYTVSAVEKSQSGAILSLQPTYQGPYGRVSLVVMSVLDQGSEAKHTSSNCRRRTPRTGSRL